MAQLQLFDLDDPPPARQTLATPAEVRGAFWLAFTGDTNLAEVRRAYRARYGQDPAEVRRGLGGIVLAGPVAAHVEG